MSQQFRDTFCSLFACRGSCISGSQQLQQQPPPAAETRVEGSRVAAGVDDIALTYVQVRRDDEPAAASPRDAEAGGC